MKFKLDLFEEYGVLENSKSDLAYQMAWDKGHAIGRSEVASEFEKLVDLIK